MFKWAAHKGWGVVIAPGVITWPTAIMLQACLGTHTAHEGRVVGFTLTQCRVGN